MVFIESLAFTKRLFQLAGKSADLTLQRIQFDLLKNPSRGSMVRGLGGIRKARIGNPSRGKGKRSGFRYMFLYLERKSNVHLLAIFDKNETEDLNQAERKILRGLVATIKKHRGY